MRTATATASAVLAVAALALLAPATARGVDIVAPQVGTAADGWQAGTCKVEPCSPQSPPASFFTQAAGHPPNGFTQIIARHQGLFEEPVGNLKTVLVDLPPGLSVNPQATPQCALEDGKFPPLGCPANTQVGTSAVTASAGVPPISLPPVTVPGIPVYNLVPRQGEPARFGFTLPLGLGEVFLNAGVAWDGDYHEYFTIHVPSLPGVRILKNRLVFNGTAGQGGVGGAFLTTPSTCGDPAAEPFRHDYTTFLHADSVEEPAPGDDYDVAAPAPPSAAFLAGSQALAAPLPDGVAPSGCAAVPFRPAVAVSAATATTDSPSGPALEVTMPFDPAADLADSNLRTARLKLPTGLGLNPAAAPGLGACSDAQFGQGTRNPVACPPGSAIGSVSIETPVLPAGSLSGTAYLGRQLSRDPLSGEEYRVFLDAESPRFGQSVRLLARVAADPRSGQLTATVDAAPQLPFTSVRLALDGAKGVLTSPPTCGPNRTAGAFTPWSGNADATAADQGFTLSLAPGGGPCARTMAERPFAPTFGAGPASSLAAAYAPYAVRVKRDDGEQELKGVDITLPPGATARLRGVSYCPEGAIAAAAGRAGAEERAAPSCPAASLVGRATIEAGSGSAPLRIDDGRVYLAGPYRGAPLSLAVITPATAGPFDLGTVVVRVALFVDPESARVRADSDPIPDVFGGAKLDLRSIDVEIDRNEFARNGTGCRPAAAAGFLDGGGADPADPGAFSALPVAAGFRASHCGRLGFRPRLNLRLFGKVRRAQHPKLRAVLLARGPDADIRRVAVALPHALFLDQASLGRICTRQQFAAGSCPRRSVYGWARAVSPLLDRPLAGPVYLRSSNNRLPDLVAHLRGQVTIDLVGRIDSFRGGIRTVFAGVPDVPVSKFKLVLPGGRRGLLVASRDLCRGKVRAIVRMKAHNSRRANAKPRLRVPCKGKRHR